MRECDQVRREARDVGQHLAPLVGRDQHHRQAPVTAHERVEARGARRVDVMRSREDAPPAVDALDLRDEIGDERRRTDPLAEARRAPWDQPTRAAPG